MAELLGIIAGGAGLASLALQLGESAQRLRRLQKSFLDAPAILDDIAFELDTFSLMLQDLERNRQYHDSVDYRIVERCVRTCERSTGQIQSVASKLETTMRKSITRGRAHTAFELAHIDRLCNELDRSKTSLALSYQLYIE
nr:hypothetical protein CFP56_04118 [Quercus suber]